MADRAQAYAVFAAALDLPAVARDAYLSAQCGEDPALRRMVMRLLAIAEADAAATGMLIENPGPAAGDRADHVGRDYGSFRLLECLGVGGMGAVYRAERTDGVPQGVAIKILRERVSTDNSGQFMREARILARLEHPSIARLIDVGVREGEGWIAMEFVRGQPISEYCEAHGLDVPARVRLLAAVADAIATAHRALIVHRDIKPTNVLVTADGQPKLIDFGIAYALARPNETREATTDIRRLFTPHYAAPEQVRGEPVTVATDVFGLGALAYRVLAGKEPFARATSAVGYLLSVTQEDVELPSQVASAAGMDASLVRRLRGDLDCILLKALAREPARRYGEVQDLQADLLAYLDGRPVSAHARSITYRCGKFVRRHTLSLSLMSLLVTGLAIAGVLYATQERRVSLAQAAAARRGEFLTQLLKSADPGQGKRDITVAELLDQAAASLPRSLGAEPLSEASMQGLLVDTNASLGRYTQGLAASDRQLELLAGHGGTALERARALTSRGALLRTHGRNAESAATVREALVLLQPLSGVDAEREAALHELGGALVNLGQEREAERLLRAAIALEPKLAGAQGAEVATAENDLAVLLGNEGRYRESADIARQALADGQRVFPPDHPYKLVMEETYAMAELYLHEPTKAEPAQRDIIARSTRVNGPAARNTLIAQVQLGQTLTELKRYDEAQTLLRAAATGLDETEGPENAYATRAWTHYAIAACEGGDAAAGLEAAQRALSIRARMLAAYDWHLPASRASVGLCLAHLGRYPEAESLLVPAAAALEAARGPDFYNTQLAYQALRELYQGENRPADAARMAAKIRD